LRNRTFFSLTELNAAIATLLGDLNTRPFKKLEGCRQSRFERLDHAALRPLPSYSYEFAQWKKAKVHLDYHIELEHAYYSVPYTLIGETVDVRLTARMVEILVRGAVIAVHPRATQRGVFRTLSAHRPPNHCAVIETSHARLLERALAVGTATAALLRLQVTRKQHPEQTLRSAQGILRLAKDFSPERLEAACVQALTLKAYSYRAVRALITTPPLPAESPRPSTPVHDNLRGAHYFQ
jgi:hypothetical protein